VSNGTWRDNYIQFARLLDEIHSVGLSDRQFFALCAATDLSKDEINQLFDRAAIEWMRVKEGLNVRKVTPIAEIEDFAKGSDD
jgi:hypothetical protein